MERKEMAGNKIIRKTKQKKFKQARKYIICKQISQEFIQDNNYHINLRKQRRDKQNNHKM